MFTCFCSTIFKQIVGVWNTISFAPFVKCESQCRFDFGQYCNVNYVNKEERDYIMSTRCRLDVDEHNDIDDVDDVNKKEGV